jgi:hypothetical protein
MTLATASGNVAKLRMRRERQLYRKERPQHETRVDRETMIWKPLTGQRKHLMSKRMNKKALKREMDLRYHTGYVTARGIEGTKADYKTSLG